MDLLKFEGGDLYFDEELNETVAALLDEAANSYGSLNGDIIYGEESETLLLKAAEISPENLAVLVGLYRYYYYQHRYEDALQVAHRTLQVVGKKLKFPEQWSDLTLEYMGFGAMTSMQMVRFYLFALKGAAYLNLRLKRITEARAILNKLVDLDKQDRIGAQQLLALVYAYDLSTHEEQTFVMEEVS
jgi:tetratricopeptide (TPR) repeat protein